jgi:hypothetical protein
MFSRHKKKISYQPIAAPANPLFPIETKIPSKKLAQVIAMMQQIREEFLCPFKIEKNVVFIDWMNYGEGKEFTSQILKFRSQLKKLLDSHNEFDAYHDAIFGENPIKTHPLTQATNYDSHAKKGLYLYRETTFLSQIFERCPALLNFLEEELIQKNLLLPMHQAYQKNLCKLSSMVLLNNLFVTLEKKKTAAVIPRFWNSTSQVGMTLMLSDNQNFSAEPEEYEHAFNVLFARAMPCDYEGLKREILVQKIIRTTQYKMYQEDKHAKLVQITQLAMRMHKEQQVKDTLPVPVTAKTSWRPR